MRLRSLESRIVILFLALILAVQLAGFFAIRSSIQKNAQAAIREELMIGERVFVRLLDQYAQKLTQGARLLATGQQSLSLLSELRRAAEKNEFRLYVQPKIMLATGRVVDLEALVRWVHPEKGMTFPDNFIPFAEKSGFIRTLTQWMIERSAMLCKELISHGMPLRISVNISTRDLLDQDLPAKYAEMLKRHDLSTSSFCLELTESAMKNWAPPAMVSVSLSQLA
jgi:sensor c-di-GMP phosphodiesterase-like protein